MLSPTGHGPCRIGIDVGISGAIALIRGDAILGLWDMPVTAKTSGKGDQISPAGLLYALQDAAALAVEAQGILPHAYIEQATGHRKRTGNRCPACGRSKDQAGATAIFSFGKSAGIIEGVTSALGFPMTTVAPNSWKARAGLMNAEKDRSRARALQLYPSAARDLARKKDTGRADAILIARFGDRADDNFEILSKSPEWDGN